MAYEQKNEHSYKRALLKRELFYSNRSINRSFKLNGFSKNKIFNKR